MDRATSNFIAFALLVSSLMTLLGCGSSPVPAPKAYSQYVAKEKAFSCDYPEGWNADGGGKGNHWAKFTKGGVQIKVNTDTTGSLLADIAGGSSQAVVAGDEADEKAPVAKVHEMNQDSLKEEFSDYNEQEPVKFRNNLGEGRKSEFTAAGGLGGQIHGYRATFLSNNKRFIVICTCPEAEWQTLKPAFDHVLESFKSGG